MLLLLPESMAERKIDDGLREREIYRVMIIFSLGAEKLQEEESVKGTDGCVREKSQ